MGTNFNGTMINQSVTIAEKAGADIADVRNLILKYDEDGNVVIAANGTAPCSAYLLSKVATTIFLVLNQEK